MKRQLPRSTAAALVLAGAVLVSATTGAVAGSLITGAQVQNGSLTGKDVKDGSLKAVDLAGGLAAAGATGPTGAAGPTGPAGAAGPAGAPGLSGIVTVQGDLDGVPSGEEGSLTKLCPTGKVALGATAYWDDSSDAIQVVIGSGLGAVAYYENNTGGTDDLNLQVRCATVAP